MFAMIKLSYSDYEQLIKGSSPLKVRHNKPYVLLTVNGLIVKHFYKRKWWSSSTFWPYPLRFQRNCKRLAKLGWSVPHIQNLYSLPEKNCQLAIYPQIIGKTVRERAKQGDFSTLAQFPALIAKLHQQGIYLRDLHTDNIVEQQNGFVLIDVVAIKIFPWTLTLSRRARNLAHLFNTQEEFSILENYGTQKFLQQYFDAARLTIQQQHKLLSYLNKSCSFIKTQLY